MCVCVCVRTISNFSNKLITFIFLANVANISLRLNLNDAEKERDGRMNVFFFHMENFIPISILNSIK